MAVEVTGLVQAVVALTRLHLEGGGDGIIVASVKN